METHLRPQQSEPILQGGEIQNGDTGNRKDLPPDWGVSNVHRFQRCLLPYTQSRKYLQSHVQGQSYQFKALPLGLSTAPMEFTVMVKEVKLMTLYKGIRIHQYLDNWLVRARPHQTCLQQTQTLVAICQELGWLVNMEKSKLYPKQVFDIVGYQLDLKEGKVRPSMERWQTLTAKIQDLMTGLTCPVQQLMSLIGLLTATEKQVHLG